MSRTFNNQQTVKVPSAGASSLISTELEDMDTRPVNSTNGGRHLRDVLGPLPALPVNDDLGGRWSLRRASGYSGIYEEILDPQEGYEF